MVRNDVRVTICLKYMLEERSVTAVLFMAERVSTTDPSLFRKNRWRNGIVWNPTRQSLDLKKIADIEKGILIRETFLEIFH